MTILLTCLAFGFSRAGAPPSAPAPALAPVADRDALETEKAELETKIAPKADACEAAKKGYLEEQALWIAANRSLAVQAMPDMIIMRDVYARGMAMFAADARHAGEGLPEMRDRLDEINIQIAIIVNPAAPTGPTVTAPYIKRTLDNAFLACFPAEAKKE